ncbi:hypothetical protein J6590_008860 [Homalodisca vitripennis]|nr:hypothetical protein J6590_008860 [Homalodisca vitripennis]
MRTRGALRGYVGDYSVPLNKSSRIEVALCYSLSVCSYINVRTRGALRGYVGDYSVPLNKSSRIEVALCYSLSVCSYIDVRTRGALRGYVGDYNISLNKSSRIEVALCYSLPVCSYIDVRTRGALRGYVAASPRGNLAVVSRSITCQVARIVVVAQFFWLDNTVAYKVKKKYGNLGPGVVMVQVEKGHQGLGISLAGHKDRNRMAVFVCGINPKGSAYKTGGIQVGDEILEVSSEI